MDLTEHGAWQRWIATIVTYRVYEPAVWQPGVWLRSRRHLRAVPLRAAGSRAGRLVALITAGVNDWSLMRLFDLTSEGTAVPLIPGEDAEIAKTRRGVGDSPEIGSGERHLPTGLSIDLAEVPDTEYDLAALLDQVVTTLTRFVAFTDHHQAVITALYVAATHSVAQGWTVPYLTIYRWRYFGSGPPAIKVGRHLRVDPVDLADWVDERRDQRATPPARGFGGGGGC